MDMGRCEHSEKVGECVGPTEKRKDPGHKDCNFLSRPHYLCLLWAPGKVTKLLCSLAFLMGKAEVLPTS